MTDTERLRKLAEKATPGPWSLDPAEPCLIGGDPQGSEGEWGQRVAECEDEDCAAFIAAVSPDVVLRLLDVAEAARPALVQWMAGRGDPPRLTREESDLHDALAALAASGTEAP